MKIEHWHCQANHPNEQLQYSNLLGACMGGEGQPKALQHCDTKKGNRDLKWNPANPLHRIEARVRYELTGIIRSDDQEFDDQLCNVLNLNIKYLQNNRKVILDTVLDWWKAEKARIRGAVPRASFERKRDAYLAGHSARDPFSPVAVWWLEQRLARMPT